MKNDPIQGILFDVDNLVNLRTKDSQAHRHIAKPLNFFLKAPSLKIAVKRVSRHGKDRMPTAIIEPDQTADINRRLRKD